MPVAFPGPYVDQSLSQQGPFDAVTKPAAVTNPRDLGLDRSYSPTRGTTRTLDLSGQQTAPKPFPPGSWALGHDPYANGGGLAAYLDNSGD